MSEFSMDRVVAILKGKGVLNAYVEQTGGGVATIFAGPTFEEEGYGTRYAACAGPGTYGWAPGSDSMGDTDEFCVGLDDYGDGPVKYASDEGWTTVEQIADAIYEQVVQFAAERMAERIDDDIAAKAIPPRSEWLTFAGLQSFTDANMYVAEVLTVPDHAEQPFFDLCNDVITRTDALLTPTTEGATS